MRQVDQQVYEHTCKVRARELFPASCSTNGSTCRSALEFYINKTRFDNQIHEIFFTEKCLEFPETETYLSGAQPDSSKMTL